MMRIKQIIRMAVTGIALFITVGLSAAQAQQETLAYFSPSSNTAREYSSVFWVKNYPAHEGRVAGLGVVRGCLYYQTTHNSNLFRFDPVKKRSEKAFVTPSRKKPIQYKPLYGEGGVAILPIDGKKGTDAFVIEDNGNSRTVKRFVLANGYEYVDRLKLFDGSIINDRYTTVGKEKVPGPFLNLSSKDDNTFDEAAFDKWKTKDGLQEFVFENNTYRFKAIDNSYAGKSLVFVRKSEDDIVFVIPSTSEPFQDTRDPHTNLFEWIAVHLVKGTEASRMNLGKFQYFPEIAISPDLKIYLVGYGSNQIPTLYKIEGLM